MIIINFQNIRFRLNFEILESWFCQETPAEGEEVSLDFESFLHSDGTLYSCFHHHGNRVYVDESQVETPTDDRTLVLCPLGSSLTLASLISFHLSGNASIVLLARADTHVVFKEQ